MVAKHIKYDFFFVDMKIFERCLKVEFRFHTPRETFSNRSLKRSRFFLPLVFVFTVVTGFTQKSEVQCLILSRHLI